LVEIVGRNKNNLRLDLAETQALISCVIYYLKKEEISLEERRSILASGQRLRRLEATIIQRSQKHGRSNIR
jgi:hypothetical protein